MKLVPYIAALVLSAIPLTGMAEPASDSQMAEEASHLPRDPARRQQRLEVYRDRLYSLVQQSPETVRAANVFFNRGLTTLELEQLMGEYQLEVMGVNLKAPQGDKGVVMSLGLGSDGVLATDGSLSVRLSFAVAAHQECFAKRAEYFPEKEAQDWRDLSTVTFRVYSASIFGSATALQQLQESFDVTSVVVNRQSGLIEDFQDRKKTNVPNIYKMPGFLC